MKEFVDKLISRLEEREVQAYAKVDGGVTYQAYRNAIEIVTQVAEEYNNRWIPCSEKLPEEPSIELDDENDIRAAILHNKVTEYIVTIHAASKSTAAYYIGDGFWYDEITKDICPVDAWREFPEGYQKTD